MTQFENAQEFAEYGMLFRLLHPPKRKIAKATNYDEDDIRQMRMNGASVKEIAIKYKTSDKNIRNYLSRKGIVRLGK